MNNIDNIDNIDKITLQYLLNPNTYDKINISNHNINYNLEEFKNYKKEILDLTEDMFNDKFINNEIKEEFNNYCKNIIYHIRNENFKKIVQNEYKELKPKIKKKIKLDISNNNLNMSNTNLNISNTNLNMSNNNLNSFIIKTNGKDNKILSKNKILPEIKDTLKKYHK